jgi:hypothetical protein
VVTTRSRIEGFRYEVAFGEDVGYLPVRVRSIFDQGKRPDGELIVANFKHFRIEGGSFHFPTEFSSRYVVGQAEPTNGYTTKIERGTLKINQPISTDLLRLNFDPVILEK